MLGLLDDMDLHQAVSVGRRAAELMSTHNVAPTPKNYAVWFAYASGRLKSFEQLVAILISANRPFDEATLDELYRHLLGLNRDGGSIAQEISERLQTVVDQTLACIQTAQADSLSRTRSLDSLEQATLGTVTPQELAARLNREIALAVDRTARLEKELGSMSKEVTTIQASLRREREMATIDPLTGLANRRRLDDFLKQAQIVSMETNRDLSVLFIDIDHFKSFNDNFGHQVGDQVLRLIAATVKSASRHTDLVARYGGEEIMVVLPGTGLSEAAAIAEAMRTTIAERKITRRATREVLSSVSVSIGVAQFRLGESMNALLERCDQALYLAKRSGRNCTRTEVDLAGELV